MVGDLGFSSAKFRIYCQGFPMAFIMEQAGGSASCGMFKGPLESGNRVGSGRGHIDMISCVYNQEMQIYNIYIYIHGNS